MSELWCSGQRSGVMALDRPGVTPSFATSLSAKHFSYLVLASPVTKKTPNCMCFVKYFELCCFRRSQCCYHSLQFLLKYDTVHTTWDKAVRKLVQHNPSLHGRPQKHQFPWICLLIIWSKNISYIQLFFSVLSCRILLNPIHIIQLPLKIAQFIVVVVSLFYYITIYSSSVTTARQSYSEARLVKRSSILWFTCLEL